MNILQRSTKATCGLFEREIVVPSEKVGAMKKRLRDKGFVIVGTSESIGRNRKIWFVPAGMGF
ncbi:hypothetical protein LCGC14_1060550 [marine sediment metagenome]|uniref:Uncharacterized protein n=1 Tax=marine sediment metagenome TaxID=412755 RepID=A0A0F9Q455_9ZZZZ